MGLEECGGERRDRKGLDGVLIVVRFFRFVDLLFRGPYDSIFTFGVEDGGDDLTDPDEIEIVSIVLGIGGLSIANTILTFQCLSSGINGHSGALEEVDETLIYPSIQHNGNTGAWWMHYSMCQCYRDGCVGWMI